MQTSSKDAVPVGRMIDELLVLCAEELRPLGTALIRELTMRAVDIDWA